MKQISISIMFESVAVFFVAISNLITTFRTQDLEKRIENLEKAEMSYYTDTLTPIPTAEDTLYAMATAFAIQESRLTDNAVSDCGTYVGCLQISPVMVREANRILGSEVYNYDDRYSREHSYGIFNTVIKHHNPTLNIDKAVDIWNPRCDANYRENVRNFYNNNLLNYNEHDML